MTLEEKKARIEELRADHNRQPKDDAELEALQREVGLATAEEPKEEVSPIDPDKLSFKELKEMATQRGFKFNPVGLSKEKLVKLLTTP